ncbi:MAG: DegV family protein [Firmicutes bacterium]|nr:DegV family protein [Bacillota bacterium]
MSKLVIVVDSACDLPAELCEELSLQIVPLYVNWSGKTFKDRVELDTDSFYPRLLSESELPQTSQPTPGDFVSVFEELLDQGKDILCLTISSQLSGTYQSAVAAKQQLEGQGTIEVIDTLAASVGQGLLAVEAASLASEGKELPEIVEAVTEKRDRLRSIFTIDTLENLVRGGRLSKLQGGLGTLLDIKPVLHLEAGKIMPLTKVRSRKRALALLDTELEKQGVNLQGQVMGVSHVREPELAKQKADLLREKYGAKDVIIGEIGSVIGTHTGQGCVAIFFYGEKR